jgi:hypothetical protein
MSGHRTTVRRLEQVAEELTTKGRTYLEQARLMRAVHNIITRAAPEVRRSVLFEIVRSLADGKDALATAERLLIEEALSRAKYIQDAADDLGITKRRIGLKIMGHGIEPHQTQGRKKHDTDATRRVGANDPRRERSNDGGG